MSAACVVLAVCAAVSAEGSKTATTHPGQARTKSHTSASKASSRKSKKSHKASWRRGQQKVDPKRAREIQEALIREHYLNGKASGVWDDASQRAMERYQADNGWQSKAVPDSRALIKLGLGPDHEHLLNPESAMTVAPPPPTPPSASKPALGAPAPNTPASSVADPPRR